MQQSSPISIALIGCGSWGPNQARAFHNQPESRLVAASDIDHSRLERLGAMYPVLRLETDYRAILADESVNAVVVATPTQTHYEIVKDALLAGKHVLCEKPLCKDEAEAQELAKLSDEVQRLLMVGHVFLFNSGIIKIREMARGGELGHWRYLSAVRTNLGPIRSDVNAAYDLAAHDIAIFNWLLDAEPEMVSALGASFLQSKIEDVVLISMRYPGNVLANIQASWLDPKKVRQMTVVGSRRMVTWDDLQLTTPVTIYEKGVNVENAVSDYGEFLRVAMWDGDVRMPKIQQEEPLKVQARFFLDAIRRGGGLERSDASFGVGVVRVLAAVAQSLASNGQPVTLSKSVPVGVGEAA
jgi:predicted dehydrogenase